jgi:signal transduction histidine kinase
MRLRQRNHIATVIDIAREKADNFVFDAPIIASWRRCIDDHGLDPARLQSPVVVPRPQLSEHQERMQEFLSATRHEMESLHQQIAGLGYCVLLADAHGVTVDFIGDNRANSAFRKAGLYPGSTWREESTGTTGVGTCLATAGALTVHQCDHFDATHIALSCTAAPIFDCSGALHGVLNISALCSPQTKCSQFMALRLTKVFAQRVETAYFLHRFKDHWILKLVQYHSQELLLALDQDGRIIGHNQNAKIQLTNSPSKKIIGVPVDDVLSVAVDSLVKFCSAKHAFQQPVSSLATRQAFYMRAVAPPTPGQRASAGSLQRAGRLTALGAIVSGISHELNTPLGNSKLALSSLCERIHDLKASYEQRGLTRSLIEKFLEESMHIAELANSATDKAIAVVDSYKQLASEQAAGDRRLFDLAEVVSGAVKVEANRNGAKAWTVALDIPAGIIMDSYPEAFCTMISHLMRNSVQHGFEGRTCGHISIVAQLEDNGDKEPSRIVLIFSDDGHGIDPSIITRIFDPFFTTRFGRGCTGLGLTITHRLVTALLCGEISVQSTLGTGVSFKHVIPLRLPVRDRVLQVGSAHQIAT